MERKTALGVAVVALGIAAVLAVVVLAPTATCQSNNGAVGGIRPIEFGGVAHGDILYSRDAGASTCSIPITVLGVPAGLVVAGGGLLALGS